MIHRSPLSLGRWFNSSPEQLIICGGGNHLSRRNILHRVAMIQDVMLNKKAKSCALFTADTTLFVATFLACACTGVKLILPANNTAEFTGSIEADISVGDWPEAASLAFSPLPEATPQHFGESFELDIYTSGSTGEPKCIRRDINQLLSEVNTLQETFADVNDNMSLTGIFAATVSHQHIYGLLFKILWPLLSGQMIWHRIIAFEESLETLLNEVERVVLVSSPAFLKRIYSKVRHQGQLVKVFSSGGMLSDNQQQLAENKLSTKIIQVYGSSETGGIGYRQLQQKWQLFKNVKTQLKNEVLWVNSPYCYQTGWFCTQDRVKTSTDGFELMGRNDRIVKIEEKRVSLSYVEKLLRDHRFISDAAVISLENGRQYLGALVVLNKTDQHQLKTMGLLKLKQDIKAFLSTSLDTVAIPRKITFTTESLENTQGKRVITELKSRLERSLK